MATLAASVRSTFPPATTTATAPRLPGPSRSFTPTLPALQPPTAQIKLNPKLLAPSLPSGSNGSGTASVARGIGAEAGSVGTSSSLSACSVIDRSPFVARLLAGDDEPAERFALAVKWSLRLEAAAGGKDSTSKISRPGCGECGLSLARALLCLECGDAFCDPHAHTHLDNTQHSTFFDLRSCAVYDALGEDYIFHPALERLIEIERNRRRSSKRSLSAHSSSKRAKLARPGELSIPRGLRNLGQTCYMSVILQAFVHNPQMRAFFLGDSHNRALCENAGTCFGCEIDRLFSEVYAGSRGPFAPTRFLYAMWQSSAELSGYAQQDAQEFLISTLNLLHSATCAPENQHGHDATCTCVAHSTFGGLLKSEVTCGHCQNVSTSTDPFLDLSLDLRARSGVKEEGSMSLERCLERFTSAEGTEYSCARCGMQGRESKASKRLRIERLPKVLAVQLKRFEHTNKSSKVEDDLSFPFSLDPSPFLATTNDQTNSQTSIKYRLHTVVVHIGSLSNGHYVAYVLGQPGSRGEARKWYYTSDDEVRECASAEVEKAKAYMLFYEQE